METSHIIRENHVKAGMTYLGGPAGDLPDILPSGDWSPYRPLFESQNKWSLDTYNCVQCSRAVVCGYQSEFQGKPIDLSERFWCWSCGSTRQGNSYSSCDAGIRSKGAVTEDLWPWLVPMDWETYAEQPPTDVVTQAMRIFDEWDFGQLVWVPLDIASMQTALKKGPLWFCNSYHSMVIESISDRIYVFDTEANVTHGTGSFPLDYVSQIEACYLAPFTPKTMNVMHYPANSIIVVVDGLGQRFLNADNTKLYAGAEGDIAAECQFRNLDAFGLTKPFSVVHVKTADILGVPVVDLKGNSLGVVS